VRLPRPAAAALAAALAAAVLPVAACGGAADREQRLRVLAAASLTGPFEQLAADFEAEHAGVDVQLSFGGSSDLVAQVQEGAPADVLATADTASMDRVAAADLLDGPPRVFATNLLQLAVPPGNPAGVSGLGDLDGDGVRLVVCAPQVPCGAAAQRVARAAGVGLDPVSEEQSVTDVLGKVVSGEADAGLVYITDVLAAGAAVEGVDVPEAAGFPNVYPLAVLADSPRSDLARTFVELVLGDDGRSVLRGAGFGAP
jgi:molybdate transport system substrate-binding protein